MRLIDSLLNQYAESHQTTFNKRVHYICVPAIFFSLIGLLAALLPMDAIMIGIIPNAYLGYAHFGTVLIIFGLIYYIRLSIPLFIGMFFFSGLVLFGIEQIRIAQVAPLWVTMLGIFVLAWIIQFIGHNHEGKKPSFLEDLQFLMIGPAWTISHLFQFLRIKF